MRQQYERKVGPGRLTIQPAHQPAQIPRLDGLFGDHGKAGAALDLVCKRGKVTSNIGVEARLPDQGGGHRGIAALRREDDGPLG